MLAKLRPELKVEFNLSQLEPIQLSLSLTKLNLSEGVTSKVWPLSTIKHIYIYGERENISNSSGV